MGLKNCSWIAVQWMAILISLHGAASLNRDCPGNCVLLQECPPLIKLIRNPTRDNIRILQNATCSFSGINPKVCCPIETSTNSPLLPKRCGQGESVNRIHGGLETRLGGYPWMAILGYKEIGFDEVDYLCAGSIINDRYILTAAHCLSSDIMAIKTLEVIGLGEWDLTTEEDCQVSFSGDMRCAPPTQNFTYEEIIIHPEYNTRAIHSDDIALIRLSKKIDLSGNWMHPICLPPKGLRVTKVMHKPEGIVAGWGTTEHGTTSNRLLHVVLPLVNNSQCNETYSGNTVKEQICMGGAVGEDSCGGDSGGPLVIRGPGGPPYLLIGIVSYGPSNCGSHAVPGVYTDVTYYMKWIEENIRP